ncbi:PREDICTED: LOW QUALITY PROTEIN: constitutive coactivator of peroxisome proliferator-activated receptor gamma-like [Branchiostoma belcheri]|uniref:LOW QUALITY PROTEIN: constitutive coactivator of peroxisome proliferator-activated receptor gamma-like n=1 Tax=Branchiostoma belcheri TaxID=7741 RepID=A0A6P4YWG0_BRABE|nr:PREDICTED: LOW QUALITY PROTEIN: constitutive coactivator of peroxisome proliferator-activated receptor gamma-like [Branchiostoma belcheri]
MGVRGLQTYLERHCPEACVKVNLSELARQYHRQHGTRPVMVVDGLGCLRKLYNRDLPWVYGGQWREYYEELRQFLQSFRTAGIDLVFIFDGVVEKSKRAEWVKRRQQSARDVVTVFSHIKKHGTQPSDDLFQMPVSLGMLTRFALKSLGAYVLNTTKEADIEIAEYCMKYPCFGILGQDTDFVIFNTVPFYSSNNLDISTLTTVQYSRERLCYRLQIGLEDLPLFSCLMGNDIIKSTELESFKRRQVGVPANARFPRVEDVVMAVSRYMQTIPQGTTIRDIARDVFPNEPDKWLRMEEGARMYLLPGDPLPWYMYMQNCSPHALPPFGAKRNCRQMSGDEEITLEVDVEEVRPRVDTKVLQLARERHLNSDNIAQIYNILISAETDSSVAMEDETSTDIPSSSVLFRPIRQRMYAVLYGNAVKEWCPYRGNTLTHPDVVTAIPLDLPGGTPPLSMLWFSPVGPQAQHLRLQTFFACMDCVSLLECVKPEPHYIILCLVLHYMVKHMLTLQEWEVDAFLAQAVVPFAQDVERLQGLKVPRVAPRPVHLAAVFLKGVSYSLFADCACGWPITVQDGVPWNYFDGKLFNYKYLMAEGGADVRALCDHDERALQLFWTLKECVTVGTRLDQKGRQMCFPH